MATTIPPLIEDILLSIFVLIITIALSWIVSQFVLSRLMDRTSKANSKWISRVIQYIILAIGIYFVVYHILLLDLRTFAASLGIIGIAVAFSSQQLIQNVIAGILIAVRRPIQLEDWIEVGTSGVCKVRDIGLLQTEIRGINGNLIYLPNSVLLNSMIINYTKAGASLITIPFQIQSVTNYDVVKDLLLEVANEIMPDVEPRIKRRHKIVQKFLPHISALIETKKTVRTFEPEVIITDLNNGKMTINLKIWTENIERKDDIISQFIETVHRTAKEKNITF